MVPWWMIMLRKDTNPKDAVGISKWRQFCTVPFLVIWEVGVGMLEGARKYGRHNYRKAGVRASVYVDAALGHVNQWWEGEDTDADSGLSHITKAICSLVVLRDAMINDMLTDDRPPRGKMDEVRQNLQRQVEAILARYPDAREPFTQAAHGAVGMDVPVAQGSGLTPAEIDRQAVVDREVNARWFTDCCMCGAVVDMREAEDGEFGEGCQLYNGEWVCSSSCYDKFCPPAPVRPIHRHEED